MATKSVNCTNRFRTFTSSTTRPCILSVRWETRFAATWTPAFTNGNRADSSDSFLTMLRTLSASRVSSVSTSRECGNTRRCLEPLLFYVLHRADAIIRDPQISHVFKAFFIDEAWVFLKNPSIRAYIVEALKTWRKHNAALVLSTQSLDELRKSDILDVILESCVTKIFLANPEMDRELYQQHFHLNDHEIELIAGLDPKAANAHQDARYIESRQSQCRCQELLALHQ